MDRLTELKGKLFFLHKESFVCIQECDLITVKKGFQDSVSVIFLPAIKMSQIFIATLTPNVYMKFFAPCCYSTLSFS